MTRRRPVPLLSRPRVSVVVPCYNYGHYLPDAVGSALDQSGVEVDVLIVDDCSTDGSATIAQRLAEADRRVDVLLHETNRGHIETYNDGLAKVTGDYVALLSADDLLTTDALTRAVALMEAEPSVGLVYGRIATFETAPVQGHDGHPRSWTVWPGEAWIHGVTRRTRNPIMSPEVVMRRDLVTEIGGYDPGHPHAGDLLMWLRAAARADVGRVNGATQAAYRQHGANMHSTAYAGAITDLHERHRAFTTFFAEHPVRGGLARAERTLAREALLIAAGQQAEGLDASATAAAALEIDPQVRTTAAWRHHQRRESRGTSTLESRALRAADAVRWGLRWQLRYRVGL